MSSWQTGSGTATLPKPGRGLTAVLVALFVVWLMFAMAVNWGGASMELFWLFCGNTELILQGQVWRLLTAPWMHFPSGGVSHILFALLGMYFLTPGLEQRWGTARTLRFLLFAGLISYGFQLVAELVLPASASAKLVPEYWHGSFPIIEAIAIAWALSFRGQTVRLMFVLPVSSSALVGFVVVMSVLRVIAAAQPPEGLLSPFGGMAAGWLLGAGTPSPLRLAYLKLKLRRVEQEAELERKRRQKRVKKSGLELLPGGKSKEGKDSKGPDGRWLN